MKFTEIIHNEHFNNLAAVIRTPFWSPGWRNAREDVPFWTLVRNLDDVTHPEPPKMNRERVLAALLDLLTSISAADERLSYSEEDLDWLVSALDGPQAGVVIQLFKAWFSAPDTLYSPAELSAVTGDGESTWRHRAASGIVPGSVKKGKQWLLPESMLLSRGLLSREEARRLQMAYSAMEGASDHVDPLP